ncbi:hypothetical protein [Streptomyces fructofermentans]|uniref:hypothetical protein n=1 Tax=Streptomyces fructofermentans TaxID=152141 RepID=UPI00378E5153
MANFVTTFPLEQTPPPLKELEGDSAADNITITSDATDAIGKIAAPDELAIHDSFEFYNVVSHTHQEMNRLLGINPPVHLEPLISRAALTVASRGLPYSSHLGNKIENVATVIRERKYRQDAVDPVVNRAIEEVARTIATLGRFNSRELGETTAQVLLHGGRVLTQGGARPQPMRQPNAEQAFPSTGPLHSMDDSSTGVSVSRDQNRARNFSGFVDSKTSPVPLSNQDGRHQNRDSQRSETSDPTQNESEPSLTEAAARHRGQASVVTDYTLHRAGHPSSEHVFRRVGPMSLTSGFAREVTSSSNSHQARLVTVQQQIISDQHPDLLVSGDGTLAINRSAEAREVFTTVNCFLRAEAALRAAGSRVRLVQDTSVKVAFTHQGVGRALHPVRPDFEAPSDVCRDVAGSLIGGTPDHIVFRSPEGLTALSPMSAADSLQVPEVHSLAEALVRLADDSASVDAADAAWAARETASPTTRHSRETSPSRAEYGHYSGERAHYAAQRQRLGAVSERSGINNHAWARVGEAYLTQSVGKYDESGRFILVDHARETPLSVDPFGYHYATALLESEDGLSQVTLENYSRSGIRRRTAEAAVDQNLLLFGEQLEAMRNEHLNDTTITSRRQKSMVNTLDSLLALRRAAQNHAEIASRASEGTIDSHALRQARNAVDTAKKSATTMILNESSALGLGAAKDSWFMRFVSRAQSFHSHMTDPAARMVNPLTVVVVGKHAEFQEVSRFVDFPEKSSNLDEARIPMNVKFMAQHAARIGIWNLRNGLPAPVINISVGGNGSPLIREEGAKRTAQRRLDSLHEIFVELLQASLEDLQSHFPPGERLTISSFTVINENRGRSLPVGISASSAHSEDALRRRAIIRMEMHPNISQMTPRPYRASVGPRGSR